MTQIDIKSQIQALIAQHMSQIQSMMSSAKAQETDAIYAGFVADREEQRKNAIEGELGIWNSKMAVGDTASTSAQISMTTSSLHIQRKIEAKIDKLEKQKNYLNNLIKNLKQKAQDAKANPLTALLASILQPFISMLESMFRSKEKEALKLSQTLQARESSNVMVENAEKSLESSKTLQESMLNKANNTHIKINQKTETVDSLKTSKSKEDNKSEDRRETLVSRFNALKEKLNEKGIALPSETISALENAVKSNDESKVVLDRSLRNELYQDLVSIVGQDNVILDRRSSRNSDDSDRRKNSNIINPDLIVERSAQDRRQNNARFLG